jgi:hypothetical protein
MSGDDMESRTHMSTRKDYGWMFLTGLGLSLATVGFVRLINNRLTVHEAMVLLQQEDNTGTRAYTRSLNRLAERMGMEDADALRDRWHNAKNRKPLFRSAKAGS